MESLKNYLILLLAVTVIGVSILAWQQYQELGGLRTAALKPDERAGLQKAAWGGQKRIRQLEGELAIARNQAGAAASTESVAGGTGPAANQARVVSTVAAGMASMMSMMDNPDVQRLMAVQQKGQLNSRYGALFKNLHLNPEQLAQLKNLLVEKQMANTDVMIAATQQGINPMQNPKEFGELMQGTQAEIDSKIRTALGEEGFAQFQNFQQTQGQRSVITQLEQSLSYTDAPLTSAQSEQMMQILAQSSAGRANAGGAQVMIAGPGGDGGLRGGTTIRITDETIARSQSVLSAPQVQALQDIQQQQQAAAQLSRLMMQNQGRASGGTMPPLPPGGG